MPAHLIVLEGPHKGLFFNLEKNGEWVVGKDADIADFFVDEETLSRKQARLTKTAEGVQIKNLSRISPTLVNGQEILEPTALHEHDLIQMGDLSFVFQEGEIPEFAYPPQKKELPKKNTYDDIFSDLEETDDSLPPPPRGEAFSEMSRESTIYDTIFEDDGAEEELPFHLLSNTPLLLKVIAGPNAGAEIGIEKGKAYAIGKDPNVCDIVFQDLSVSRSHSRLTIDENGDLFIEDLGSKNGTLINGHPISEKTPISSQDLIATGTTVFLVIDREEPQETIYAPLLPSIEESSPNAIQSPPAEEIPETPPVDWKKEPIPKKHLVIGSSFALIFAVIFLTFFSLFKSQSIEKPQPEPVSEIKKALDPFTGVQFSFNPASGKLFLVGHVLTQVNYQDLTYRLSQIPFIATVEDTVVIDEGVSKMMNDILSTHPEWKGVSIRALQAGNFVALGYVKTGDELALLSDYLTKNFPYLDQLKIQITVTDNLDAQLESLLMGHGFGAVSVEIHQGTVVLSGLYSEEKEREFKRILKEIQKIPGIARVQNLAAPTSKDSAAVDLSKQYQVSGSSLFDGRGYSVILNGKIYTLGDAVDGMRLVSIEQNIILLEKDGIKYKIDYTR